jgi:hypothetical protein
MDRMAIGERTHRPRPAGRPRRRFRYRQDRSRRSSKDNPMRLRRRLPTLRGGSESHDSDKVAGQHSR